MSQCDEGKVEEEYLCNWMITSFSARLKIFLHAGSLHWEMLWNMHACFWTNHLMGPPAAALMLRKSSRQLMSSSQPVSVLD
jgi:hypothetical protein